MTLQRFAADNMAINYVHFGGFQAPLRLTCDFVVVDFETTSLHASQGARILEVAAHRTRGDGKTLETFTTLINPWPAGESGDTGAVHIHGITGDMIKDAPSFPDVWPALSAFLSDAIFVAHHAWFDASFLAAEIDRYELPAQVMPALCTYWLARAALPHEQRHNLEAVAALFGVAQGRAHEACADAQVVVELLPTLTSLVQPVGHYVAPVAAQTRVATRVVPRSN